ncbi:hypothetical protein BXU09_17350 [Deinococcus sp. LM3]|nr:hypothetical protein BXU09_16160 [Deinococcus sp. LM3]OOV12540.1 hypothetical protein BXU09_17350 [Deinococcus sp. LM3]
MAGPSPASQHAAQPTGQPTSQPTGQQVAPPAATPPADIPCGQGPQPTLAQWRAFVVAAQRGSFSAAAIELNVTQSALSHALRLLERTLGVPLLRRGGRGVQLTPAGQRVLPGAQRLVDAARTLIDLARSAELHGTVTVAAFPSLARHLLPGALRRLRGVAPGVNVAVDDAHLERDAVYRAVQSGQADVGLTQLLPGSALNARPLGEDPYLLVLPAHWTLPGAWQRPYIHLGDPHDRRVPDALARHGVRVRPALSLNSEAAIAAMVAGELGFAVLPHLTMPELPPGVLARPLPWSVSRTYGTVVRPGPVTPAVQAVLDALWPPDAPSADPSASLTPPDAGL